MKKFPSVTGILITGKTIERYPLAKTAVKAWMRQDYVGDRKLLVINDNLGAPLYPKGTPFGVEEIRVPTQQPLGALRNIGIDAAETEYVVQWDDDDFAHPTRLTWQVANTVPGRASIFQWEIHCNLLTGNAFANNGRSSRCGGFAGTMLWPADTRTRFPHMPRHEDTEFILQIRTECGLRVLKNDPKLYFRCYHGFNTWSQKHVMQRKPGSRNLTPVEQGYVTKLLGTHYVKVQQDLLLRSKQDS